MQSKSKEFIELMRGNEEVDKKSDLQKLLEKRRSETQLQEADNGVESRDRRQPAKPTGA